MYEIYLAIKRKPNKPGEWSTSKVVSKNNYVGYLLNDVKNLEYERGLTDFRKRVAESKFSEYSDFGEAKKGHILF